MIRDLILKNRSYRRFDTGRKLTRDELLELIDLARISSSASNRQPLRFHPSWEDPENGKIFSTMSWAGFIEDWDGPGPDERPAGYIVVLQDMNVSDDCSIDIGIASQSILLGAVEMGLGGCMVASFDRNEIASVLSLPEHIVPGLIIALGRPVEKVVLEPVRDGDTRYYRDEDGTHHVPKRSLNEILFP